MANRQNEANIEKENRYNGWTNYETWAVSLWIDNEQASQAYWQQEAKRAIRESTHSEMVQGGTWTSEEAARFQLAKQLKEEITDAGPSMGATVYADLLQAALDSVNWQEIADNLIAELDE